MVKRGKRLSPDTSLGYKHPTNKKLIQKKYSWICEVCGREFPFRSQAEECEALHILEETKKQTDLEKEKGKIIKIAEILELEYEIKERSVRFWKYPILDGEYDIFDIQLLYLYLFGSREEWDNYAIKDEEDALGRAKAVLEGGATWLVGDLLLRKASPKLEGE